jgi:hypothetical protein
LMRLHVATNVPAHRPRASDAPRGTATRSRGSVQPVCYPICVSWCYRLSDGSTRMTSRGLIVGAIEDVGTEYSRPHPVIKPSSVKKHTVGRIPAIERPLTADGGQGEA